MGFIASSSLVTWIVLLWLVLYAVAMTWIFVERYMRLKTRIATESDSLRAMYTQHTKSVSSHSLLHTYLSRVSYPNRAILDAANSDAIRVATKGLTWLSIIASTAPFVGLFGTVVGILETFGKLDGARHASLGVVAPAISEALVATAAGIVVAIFAYMFHLVLKRKAYELSSLLTSQADVLLSQLDREA